MVVYGLLVHSVETSQTLYLSCFYTPEGNDLNRNIRQQTIMRKILSEFLFKVRCHDSEQTSKSTTDEDRGGERDRRAVVGSDGLFWLKHSELFEQSKIAIWKEVDRVSYTLVVEPTENLLLASSFLTLLAHTLTEIFSKSRKVTNKGLGELISLFPDTALVVLEYLLPAGQLLFTNLHQGMYYKQLIQQTLKAKT
eukprot:GHVS01105434.1.p1 GENE.GHVS01105434.1~~GHVS01105434.1.p1  ORF type:complete len:195 (-),score=21.87 GHVS01105434.1:158-742(-)